MRVRFYNLWLAFASNFWFAPGLLMAGGVAAAIFLPEVDRLIDGAVPDAIRVSGDTARATLTTLAGAMVTVTGIVFSTTTVAISITAAQHGPRLLRNFFSRSVTQTTLGVCLAVSVYCLLLMRTVDGTEGEVFVPQLSLLAAYAFVLAALVAIILFTHQVASLMQTQNVASDVADELDFAVARLYPDPYEDDDEEDDSSPAWRECWEGFDVDSAEAITASRDGYVQAIDADGLVRLAKRRDLLFRVEARPGDYVREGDTLLNASPEGQLSEGEASRASKSFIMGNIRTPQQDVECAVLELVEISVRALSPGVNDPFTAVTCVDRLSGALRRLAGRKPAKALWRDGEGEPRLVAKPRDFPGVVDAAFNQIRQYSRSDVSVTVRLLQSIEAIAPSAYDAESVAALRRQAEMVYDGAKSAGHTDHDLADIKERYEAALSALDGRARTTPN